MRFFFLFFALIFSSVAYSATPEEEFAKNREMISKALNDPNYSKNIRATSNGNEIIHRYSKSFPDSDGLKRTVEAVVKKTPDPVKVGKTMAERLNSAKALGKASIPSFLGSAALTALLNGIGWVMDDGGKVTYLEVQDPSIGQSCGNCAHLQNVYYINNWSHFGNYSDQITAAWGYYHSYVKDQYTSNPTVTGQGNKYRVTWKNTYYGSTQYHDISVYSKPNPYYDPNAVSSNIVEVDTDKLAEKIAEQIRNPTYQTAEQNNKSLVGAAYSSDPTFNLSDQSVNGLANKIGEQVGAGLKNALATATGSGVISDPLDGSQISVGVTPADDKGSVVAVPSDDIDPVTGEPVNQSGKFSLEFPKFCTWANPVCSFIDWFYEKYEVLTEVKDQDNELDLEEDDSTSDDVDTDIEFHGFCPPKKVIDGFRPPFSSLKFEFKYDLWCDMATDVKPIVIAFSLWMYVLIVTGFNSKGDD